MDAKRMGIKAIKEGIFKGNYELTGVLESGELTIALVNKSDQIFIKEILDSNKSNDEKLERTKELIETKGRAALELMQIYEQKCSLSSIRCGKNGLRIIENTSIKKKELTDSDFKEIFEIVRGGMLESEELIRGNEEEVAIKILRLLKGNLIIRATSILEFCIKYLQYTDF